MKITEAEIERARAFFRRKMLADNLGHSPGEIEIIAEWMAEYAAHVSRPLKEALTDLPKHVPTNWLDPLLSGPEKVIDADCRQVEALLRGVQDRLRKAADAALKEAGE